MNILTLKFSIVGLAAQVLFFSASLFAAELNTDDYTIKIKASKTDFVRISNIRTWTESGKFIVAGKVNRADSFRHPSLGHINVVVLYNNKNVIAAAGGNYVPAHINRSAIRASTFQVKLPNVPQKDSLIEVSFERNAYDRYITVPHN